MGLAVRIDNVAGERDELRRLVEELTDDQVSLTLADVRHHLRAARRPWPPAWFGAATTTRTDVAARSEELLADGFGRSG
jgi:hypothetical protein